jgi:ABC-type antimicrobial peptide transport system permease subunit
VLVYTVAQRSRELGIRAALGAHPNILVREVVTRGLSTTVVGTLVGVVVALGAGRFVSSLLYDVSASDPLSLGGAAAVLIVVAGVASYFPARRAAQVDPCTVIHAE